ncbi:MAG: hypothetical protein NTY53_09285, partial [Kiritimatiellaeota bacterium]|nr:hypothetical protein [Kiritimatiellota bacterium]
MKISKSIEKLQQLSLSKSDKGFFRRHNGWFCVFFISLLVLLLLLTLYLALFLSKSHDRAPFFVVSCLVVAVIVLYLESLRKLAAIGKALPVQLPGVSQEAQPRNELLERIHSKVRIILWISIPPALAVTAVIVVALMGFFHRHWYITDHTSVLCASTNLPAGAVI